MPNTLREQLHTLDDLLALENSKKKKIERLLVTSSAWHENSLRPDYEVQVDFNIQKPSAVNPSTKTNVIALMVQSDAPGWNSRTLSAVEEQLERIKPNNTLPVAGALGVIALAVVVFLLQVGDMQPLKQVEVSSSEMWLTSNDLDRVQEILKPGHTMTEEEMREITSMQLRNLLLKKRPPPVPRKPIGRKLVLLGLPFLVIIICAITLIGSYPNYIFLWGDEVEHYNKLQQRRKNIWTFILGVMIIGIFSKFLYEGIASWVPKE